MASAKAQLKAARTFLQEGQLQQAIDACNEVLHINPASYEAHL
jgi:Tfp pilus assembly protein PilF